MERYNHKVVENYWQNIWQENNTFKTTADKSKKKFYALEMKEREKELNQESLLMIQHFLMSKIVKRSHLFYFGIPNFDESKTLTFKEAFSS